MKFWLSYCHVYEWLQTGAGLMNGYARLGTTSNYSVAVNLHNSKSLRHPLSLFQPAVSSPPVPLATASLTVEILQVLSSQPPVQNCLTNYFVPC